MATVKNIRWAMSIMETAYNDVISDPTDFNGLLSQNPEPILPTQEKETDFNVYGRGQEFPTAQIGTYWQRPRFSFTDRLNSGMAGRHLRHALGGTDVVTGAGGDKTHTIPMADSASLIQLPSYNIACWLRASDFNYMGCVCDSFSIQQQGASIPTYTAVYVGSGKWRRLSKMLIANGYDADWDADDVVDAPAFADMDYLRGASVQVEFNDGTLYDITSAGTLRAFNWSLNNNHQVEDRRVGDEWNFQDESDTDLTANGYGTDETLSGSVQGHCEYGERSMSCGIQVVMDTTTLREWDAMRHDTNITNLRYSATGKLIGATQTPHTFEIKMPIGNISSVQAGSDGDKPVINMEFMATLDTNTNGLVVGIVKNDLATAFD